MQSGLSLAAWWRCWRPMLTAGCWLQPAAMLAVRRRLRRPLRHTESAWNVLLFAALLSCLLLCVVLALMRRVIMGVAWLKP